MSRIERTLESSVRERRFIWPPKCRDAVFFMGAGASLADGVPVQREILPRILSADKLPGTLAADQAIVHDFVHEYFGPSTAELEEIFGFVEYLVAEEESLGARYPLSSLRELRERLVRLIHHEVVTSQRSGKGVYNQFWELAKEISLNISVIATNYDTLLDEAFDFLYPNHALIDYCMHFMNYEWYGDLDVPLPAFNWWVNPREPVDVWDPSAAPVPVKVIKIHGSLNWHYCPSCGQVLLTPWTKSLPGEDPAPDRGDPYALAPPRHCPWDDERFEALIVPPSHFKALHNPVLARLRGEAAQEIRSAKRIVFVGYSFPPADVHLKALITKNLRRDCEVLVVDPHVTDRIQAVYESLGRRTTFVRLTFQEALNHSTTAAAMFGHGTD